MAKPNYSYEKRKREIEKKKKKQQKLDKKRQKKDSEVNGEENNPEESGYEAYTSENESTESSE